VTLLIKTQPDEFYNLAAQSHVHTSFELPVYTSHVDGIGTLNCLEAIRQAGLAGKTKFYQVCVYVCTCSSARVRALNVSINSHPSQPHVGHRRLSRFPALAYMHAPMNSFAHAYYAVYAYTRVCTRVCIYM
jgi:hypothetical protein